MSTHLFTVQVMKYTAPLSAILYEKPKALVFHGKVINGFGFWNSIGCLFQRQEMGHLLYPAFEVSLR
jgi:hypothetical protein